MLNKEQLQKEIKKNEILNYKDFLIKKSKEQKNLKYKILKLKENKKLLKNLQKQYYTLNKENNIFNELINNNINEIIKIRKEISLNKEILTQIFSTYNSLKNKENHHKIKKLSKNYNLYRNIEIPNLYGEKYYYINLNKQDMNLFIDLISAKDALKSNIDYFFIKKDEANIQLKKFNKELLQNSSLDFVNKMSVFQKEKEIIEKKKEKLFQQFKKEIQNLSDEQQKALTKCMEKLL